MNSHKLMHGFDFSIILGAILLWVIGILMVFSATHIHHTGPLVGIYKSQIVWVAMGIMIILFIVSIPMNYFFNFAYLFYFLSLIMLVYVIFTGHVSKGAGRWIALGGIRVQPSEFAKIGLLFALAKYLSSHNVSLYRITSFLAPGILILIPFALVLRQPDLGTALVFGAMSFPMFYWAGMSLIEVFFTISPGISVVLSAIPLILAYGSSEPLGIVSALPWGIFFLILSVVLYLTKPPMFIMIFVIVANLFTATITNVLWNNLLKDYQKGRIISFINPQADPYGAGYQVIQSKVAIGSGNIVGKGYLKGSQTRLSYLPEQHTDFIFSVFGEQFGLVGTISLLMLYIFVLVRALYMTVMIKNRFLNLMIVGSVAILAFHVYVNISMVLGMMPVTGLPLPFLSYGGSFTITVSVLIGLILAAGIARSEL